MLAAMRRTSRRTMASAVKRGHCVICGKEGTSERDFVCGDCGDPWDITLYCRSCGRRWSVSESVARRFLAEHGYQIEDLRGIVMKVDRCSHCLPEGATSDLDVYRIAVSPVSDHAR